MIANSTSKVDVCATSLIDYGRLPTCPCRSKAAGNTAHCSVLYNSYVTEKEASNIEQLLIRKHKQLNRLEAIPADELTEQKWRYMESLRTEIKLIAGTFIALDQLRIAYLDETGTMAKLYWQLWANHQLADRLIADLRHELDRAREEANCWFEQYRKLIKAQIKPHESLS